MEAQACGRPVIALGRGGALETVDDGIILEVDSKTIVNRVLMQGADGSVKDITDMTISQAMEVAREQLLKNVV